MSSLLGWLGLVLLLIAWASQLTKYKKHFFLISGVASLILTIYAMILVDYPFIIVNGFIAVVSFVKVFAHDKHKRVKQKGKKKNKNARKSIKRRKGRK